MKNKIKLILLPVLALALSTGKATAGDDEAIAAVGGFIGGVIATKVFDHHKSHRKSQHHGREVVYVEERSHQGHSSCSSKHGYKYEDKQHRCGRNCSNHKPSGYYKTVKVKEWVPGCWKVRYDRCGARIKYWERGYYTYVSKKVWVSNHDDHKKGREYAYRGR